MSKDLYMSVTGCTGIESVVAGGDYSGPCQTATVVCTGTSLEVGDLVSVDIGFSDDHAVIVYGYVKEINPTRPPGEYRIVIYDVLILAEDFLIVSDDPNAPLTYSNIQAETLVGNVLALASLTNYSGSHPGFTFGVNNPVKVQLVKSWDFVRQVCHMLAWHCHADNTGKVYFSDRKPYVMGGDSSVHTFEPGSGKDLILINHTRSDEKMRNRIVVYGYDGLSASASAAPCAGISLPSGFYKTAVIAYPDIIDDQAMAQATANYNLTLLNRVTETVTLDAVGNTGVLRNRVVSIDVPALSLSGNWFVYECTHRISKSDGYRIHCVLSK